MAVMRKKEFVKKLAARFPDLSEEEVTRLANRVFDELVESMRRGERAELRGFGTFYTRRRKSRILRSPRTGRTIEIPERRIPRFKAGKALKQKADKTASS